MVGVLLVSHGPLASAMKESVEMIYGPTVKFWTMSIEAGEHPDALKNKLIEQVEMTKTSGCLILTDMLGGTPTNSTAEILLQEQVAVVTGFNLPMLLSLMVRRTEESTLEELISLAQEAGHNGIVDLKERLQIKKSEIGAGL